jgi:rRNA processing protein Gar1
MELLGAVENISYNGSLIVRGRFAPPRGSKVVDGRSKALGRVKRIFGPVAEPFIAVEPFRAPTPAILGAEVYIPQERGRHAQAKDRRG